jgi:hypothetical protein
MRHLIVWIMENVISLLRRFRSFVNVRSATMVDAQRCAECASFGAGDRAIAHAAPARPQTAHLKVPK